MSQHTAIFCDFEPQPGPGLRKPDLRSVPQVAELAGEQQILAVLDAPRGAGETTDAQFRRKEHELGTIFARLSVLEARALHKRLASPAVGDPVAERFARLVADRKQRLLAFLADARRREAIAIGRRSAP